MTCPTIGRSCSRFHLIFCSPVVTHTLRRHWFAGDSGTGLQSMRHKMLSPAISLLDSALDLLVPISILDHFTTDLLKFQPHRFHSIFKPSIFRLPIFRGIRWATRISPSAISPHRFLTIPCLTLFHFQPMTPHQLIIIAQSGCSGGGLGSNSFVTYPADSQTMMDSTGRRVPL